MRFGRGSTFAYLAVDSGIAKSRLLELEVGRTKAGLNRIAALAGSFSKGTTSELLRDCGSCRGTFLSLGQNKGGAAYAPPLSFLDNRTISRA